MKRRNLMKTTPCSKPEKVSDYVLAVSQLVEQDEKPILNIDMFYKGQLKGRYFADAKEETHWAYVDGKWYRCLIGNVARLCMDATPQKGDYYYYSTDYDYATPEDKERVKNYLNGSSIAVWESLVNKEKRKRAIDRKKDRIEELMAEIPYVPEEAEAWVEQEIFPENYLFFRKGKNQTTYSCTACGCHGWKKIGWKHREKTVCPKCGKPVIANSRQEKRNKTEPVVILQEYGQKWVERQFKAVCKWSGAEKKIQLLEQCRAIIPKGKTWGKVWYGTCSEADEFEQEFWDRNPLNKRFLSSYLYPGNLKDVLKCGGLEKSGLDILANDLNKINVNKFITTFHKRPWMEYLIKAGLPRLAAEIVNIYGWWGNPKTICTQGNSLREALRLNGNRVNRMKQINGGLSALEWLQYEETVGTKISQESLQYLASKSVSVSECEDILKELKSVNRMVNYMKKQRITPNQLVITWRDYLRMAGDEGMDTADDIVRFPKDLKARHDHLVEVRNARRNAERIEKEKEKYKKLNAQISERLPQAAHYFWENDQYMIIPAGTCEELTTEGHTLHHCVGSSDTYMNKMAEGTSWILFLRKKEDLEKAYYTVEIDMKEDRILQYYSEFDRQPDKATISKVLDEFKQSIKRSRQQVRIQVPAATIA